MLHIIDMQILNNYLLLYFLLVVLAGRFNRIKNDAMLLSSDVGFTVLVA